MFPLQLHRLAGSLGWSPPQKTPTSAGPPGSWDSPASSSVSSLGSLWQEARYRDLFSLWCLKLCWGCDPWLEAALARVRDPLLGRWGHYCFNNREAKTAWGYLGRGIERDTETASGDQRSGNQAPLTWQRGCNSLCHCPCRRGRPRTLYLNWRKHLESSFLGLMQDVEDYKILIL